VHVLVPDFAKPADPSSLSLNLSESFLGSQRLSGATIAVANTQFVKRRHLAASHPVPGVEINRVLFDGGGERWPYDEEEQLPELGDGVVEGATATHRSKRPRTDSALSEGRPPSAAPAMHDAKHLEAGPVTQAGSTLNHVVALDWSPAGLGRNGRPILGVLTANGLLTVYGAGSKRASGGMRGFGKESGQRDLTSWIKHWAVGGGMPIPGQTMREESVRSFAWSKAIRPNNHDEIRSENRTAFLAYRNAESEIVVLSVRSEWLDRGADSHGAANEEQVRWHVREAARFAAEGPHPHQNVSIASSIVLHCAPGGVPS
jgi:hypothetical protein